MRAPLRAVWPPLLLLSFTFAGFLVALFLGWWALAWLIVPGLAIFTLDARARGSDYRYAFNHLQRGRAPERIAAIFRMSWCMRIACQAAAATVDPATARAVSEWYRAEGYRWYHVTPDGTFTSQSPLFDALFWRITLKGYDEGRRRPTVRPPIAKSASMLKQNPPIRREQRKAA